MNRGRQATAVSIGTARRIQPELFEHPFFEPVADGVANQMNRGGSPCHLDLRRSCPIVASTFGSTWTHRKFSNSDKTQLRTRHQPKVEMRVTPGLENNKDASTSRIIAPGRRIVVKQIVAPGSHRTHRRRASHRKGIASKLDSERIVAHNRRANHRHRPVVPSRTWDTNETMLRMATQQSTQIGQQLPRGSKDKPP